MATSMTASKTTAALTTGGRMPRPCERKQKELSPATVQETPELVTRSLMELDLHMQDNIPLDLKQEWTQAKRACPSLVGKEHKLLFLRFENFHVELTALRLLRYWAKRVELFGDKAFEPMTMEGAMRDDLEALSFGTVIWTQAYDDVGAGIMFEDFDCSYAFYRARFVESKAGESAQDRKCTRALESILRNSLVRVAWYMFHVAMQDESVRRHGVVYLQRPRKFPIWWLLQPNICQQGKMFIDMLRGCLPIRIVAFHMCQPSIAFRILLRFSYAPRAQSPMMETTDLVVHGRSSRRILRRLTTEFGLPESAISPKLGGSSTHDHAAWLAERQWQEKRMSTTTANTTAVRTSIDMEK